MTKEPKVAAIIQARMRSTRLPGKVLTPVVGQPVLWHVLHRLRKSAWIDTLCVATTTDPADDPLVAYAEAQGAIVVRGPEDNVLERYAMAAARVDADIVVRVTADAPLVDAAFVDYLISELVRTDADFVMLKPGQSAIHEGADPMTRRALDTLVAEAGDDPVAREHVSSYFKDHRDLVKVVEIDLPPKWNFRGARLSIDTPADVTFIEAVYQRLHAQAGMASLTDLIALLTREPGLLQLNAHVQQKTAAATSGTVILRCDGGQALGMGHVRRCLSVARGLRDGEGLGVRFAVAGESAAVEAIEAEGFPVDRLPEDIHEIDALLGLGAEHKPLAWVLDVRTAFSPHDVLRLRATDTLVAVIDDGSARRLMADAAFYPPVPQVFALDWSLAEAEPCVGWEWVALGHDNLPMASPSGERPHLLLSMGGADPLGLTLPAARALAALGDELRVSVLVGPSAPAGLEDEVRAVSPDFTVLRNPPDPGRLMASADMALVAFGVTASELAAIGVPAIYVCLTEDHAASASAFVNAGMGLSLGQPADMTPEAVRAAVRALVDDPELRRSMAAAGRMSLDGRGGARIAARLRQLVEERRDAFVAPRRQATARTGT